MVRICYSASEGCKISGFPSMLRSIAAKINHLASAHASSVIIDTEINFNPHPYERVLCLLALSVGSGPVRASVHGTEIYIRGSHAALEALSSFFNFADDVVHGHQVHHKYLDGDPHIAPDSVPLIISAILPPATSGI